MIQWTLRKIVGTKNDRELKKAWPKVARINELEPRFRALNDGDLPKETARLKQEVANGRPLDDVTIGEIAQAAYDRSKPLTNIATDPEYRREMVPVYVRRAFAAALTHGQSGGVRVVG